VTFHRTPYSIAASRGAIQDRMLGELCDSVQQLDEIDWAKAESLVQQQLTPLAGI
jgi:kynurenine 3-monooxygenase